MVAHRSISSFRRLSLILLALGAVGILCWAYYSPSPAASKLKPLAPYHATELFVPQLCFLSASQLASLPIVDGFDAPCGTNSGAFCYDAQPLGAPNAKRGGKHTGGDINGIGGGSSDEGMPVHAIGRGLVAYVGTPSLDWGRVLVLAHRLPDGRVLQSMYAHLGDSYPRLGAYVGRGEVIGSIGSAGGRYVPHLHLEIIESLRVNCAQPGYVAELGPQHIALPELLATYPAPAFADPYAAIRRANARTGLQIVDP